MILVWYVVIYGSTIGFQRLNVNRQTYHSADLPKSFDGYRIVLFSDAHVGSYGSSQQWVLQQAVDSINAQRPDLIVFAGDLQNIEPAEIEQHVSVLRQLHAKDGIFSVLGNHDYDMYFRGTEEQKATNCQKTIQLQRQMGWTVLLNEHRSIQRGDSRIIIAGMENDGPEGGRFPQKGDIRRTLDATNSATEAQQTLTATDFILMLEHDPSCWRRKIVTDGRAQLTLSGHTHDMQFRLAGWSPMDWSGKEWNGWYREGQQSLYVTAGLGGLIPFRFGATGEIVVLTLKRNG